MLMEFGMAREYDTLTSQLPKYLTLSAANTPMLIFTSKWENAESTVCGVG
jgi:hypothetical protein